MTKLLQKYLKYTYFKINAKYFIGIIDIKYVLIRRKCSIGFCREIGLFIPMLLNSKKQVKRRKVRRISRIPK